MSVVLFEKKNGIGIISLNRPEKLNALSSELLNLFEGYIHQCAEDPEVKVIVIRAEGKKAFTAGFDLKESMEHNITDVLERRADTNGEVDFFKYMWYLPKPIISAVQGYCIGGGITISMFSDMIIAADNATFGNPEILLGYTMEIPMELWKMPLNKATEWFFMSKYYSAEEMREMGVVNFVVPYEELDAKTMEVAERIAKVPAESMGLLKYNIRKVFDIRGWSNAVDFTAEMFNLNRIRMQQNEGAELLKDIGKGGLSKALKDRYN